MRRRQWRLLVQDILGAVAVIRDYTTGLDQTSFVSDRKTVDAVLYNIEVIGEAVSVLPDDIKSRHMQIPWRDIRNMRNVLAHVYFGVDLERVWDVVEHDLGDIERKLQALLAAEGPETE